MLTQGKPSPARALALAGVLLLAVAAPSSRAQSGDSRGREFYLAFMPNFVGGGELWVEIHLTSELPTDVTVEYPAVAPVFSTTVPVVPGDITEVSLPAEAVRAWISDRVMDNAVHAFSDEPFIAYMINRISTTSDAALGVPVTGMGSEYFLASYPGLANGASEFTVVAASDGTTVRITPSVAVGPHPAGVPFDVLLDQGLAYHVEATVAGADDISGTLVTADRPVGVTNGHRCINVPAGVSWCDHVFEVAQPTATWGQDFILVTVPDRPAGTPFRVIGSVDGTQLRLDGVVVGMVDRGRVFDLGNLRDAHLFNATEPVFVVQFITGGTSPGATTGDPAMGNAVPLEQFLPAYTFSTVGSGHFDEHFVQLTVAAADQDAVSLDGLPVDPASFVAVPGTGWLVATLRLAEGAHRTATPGPHGVQVLGYTIADSYLFPGGTQLADLDCRVSVLDPLADALVCLGDGAVLDASGITLRDCVGAVEYAWRERGGGPLLGTDPSLPVAPVATTEYEVTLTCSADPACQFTDEATVVVHAPPQLGPPAGEDLSDCSFGLLLSWTEASFGSAAGGVYNVYRSEGPGASCADALARPPVVAGLAATRWLDRATVDGGSYVYVVEAEDAIAPSACSPVGPSLGGAVARQCLPAIAERGQAPFPEALGPVLRASHVGQEVTIRWDASRPLAPGERFRLQKAVLSAHGPFETVEDGGDAVRAHVETDESSPLQYFELRAANACEDLSLHEYGSGG